MENMSREEAMKYGFMKLSSLSKKKFMAALKSPKRRRKKMKVTSWCGPQDWDHTSPTFWDHFSFFKNSNSKASIGANPSCIHWDSLGPPISSNTRPFKPKQEVDCLSPKHFIQSPKQFILGWLLLPEASSNNKKMEHTSKVFASVTLKGANQIPAKHTEEGSRQVSCKKEASRFEENQKAVERKGVKREQEGHTKERCWILNPNLTPSKFR